MEEAPDAVLGVGEERGQTGRKEELKEKEKEKGEMRKEVRGTVK